MSPPVVSHRRKSRLPSHTRTGGGERGFSLLEILVAFAVLALTLGVLLRIFGGGVRSVALADEHAQAVLFAQSLLDQVGLETPVIPGETRGELDETYRWVLRIEPFIAEQLPLPDTLPAKPYWVVAQVEWGEDRDYHEFSLGTLRLASDSRGLGGRRP